MEYAFDVDIAVKYGANEAIVLQYIVGTIISNKAEGVNQIEGRTWMRMKTTAFKKVFPFWTSRQIGYILTKLQEVGVILKEDHNKEGFDRTMWYALNNEPVTLKHFSNSIYNELQVVQNTKVVKPRETRPKKIEDVVAYFIEKGYAESVAKEQGDNFWNHYSANGWKYGNNKADIKDWKAVVRTWISRNKPEAPTEKVKVTRKRTTPDR